MLNIRIDAKEKIMKKIISFALSIVMVLGLVAVLSSCGGSKKTTFTGKWTAELDAGELLASELGVDIGKINVKFYLTLNEDNTYSFEPDIESFEKSFKKAKPAIKEALKASFAEEMGEDADIDELFEEMGIDFDEYIDEMFSADTLEEGMEDSNYEGQYKAEDGKLYVSFDKDEEPDEDTYLEYEFDDKNITIKSDNAFEVFTEELCPAKLSK